MRFITKLIVATLTISTLAGCGERVPTFRYKMTATVDTPEGARQESTVVELRNFYESGVLGTGLESRAKGEAIPVDLGKRGTLFILLTSPDDPSLVFGMPFAALLPEQPDNRGTSEALANNYRTLAKVTGSGTLPRNAYPRFVRFHDIRDPTSVEEVDPGNLAAAFGDGVRLRGITFQITDDRRTDGRMDGLLPWLKEYHGKRFDGRHLHYADGDLPNQLSSVDFAGDLR